MKDDLIFKYRAEDYRSLWWVALREIRGPLKSEEKKNKAERQILPSHSLEKFQW